MAASRPASIAMCRSPKHEPMRDACAFRLLRCFRWVRMVPPPRLGNAGAHRSSEVLLGTAHVDELPNVGREACQGGTNIFTWFCKEDVMLPAVRLVDPARSEARHCFVVRI